MHIFYVAITILAALAYSYAASLNFVGAESVKVIADKVQVSQRWMVPLGTLLASGAIGLVIGFAVPALGVAASIGLVMYFVCALGAHIRVRDHQIAGAVAFLVLAVAALIAGLGHHNHW
jgi:DoxX-like family